MQNPGPCSSWASSVPLSYVPRSAAFFLIPNVDFSSKSKVSQAPKLFSVCPKVTERSRVPFCPAGLSCLTSCVLVHPPVQPDFSAFLGHLPIDSSLSLNKLFPRVRHLTILFSAQFSPPPETPWVASVTLSFALSMI